MDTKYQAAVKANDATTMDQVLADDFVLITGRGSVFSKADLLDSARKKQATYERQDEEPGTQKVRVWGNTAVVTALLWHHVGLDTPGNRSASKDRGRKSQPNHL